MSLRLIGILMMWTPFFGVAQVRGLVRGIRANDTLTLNGAKVKLLCAKKATFTDANGKFELFLGKKTPDTLVVLASGYLPDTVVLTREDRFSALSLMLFSDRLKPEVIVERKAKNGIVKLSIVQMERISSGELRRAACCNLSESFETNASVDVNISDAVSGARKIQLLGLDGVYTQFQLDNVPFLRGLEAAFGMQSFSGIWLEGIQISKGTGSVVNGHESMAGLINLSVKPPSDANEFLVNMYANRFGRGEVNAIASMPVSEKWATSILVNGSLNKLPIEENNDGFLDVPLYQNGAIMNRWQYIGDKMEAQLAVYGYLDNRLAGQLPNALGVNPFQMQFDNEHLECAVKTGFFGKHEGESVGIIQLAKTHKLNGFYGGTALGGQRTISGRENRYYVSVNYDRTSENGKHQFKGGVANNLLFIDQRADVIIFNRTENTSGVFAEYALVTNRLSWQTGLRFDYNSLFGAFFVPRMHLKYALTPKIDWRGTAGRGWRVPNFLIENNALLANNKAWWLPAEGLLPEISWNVGNSLVVELQLLKRKVTWTSDVYYTWFERQLVVDRDASENDIFFSYLSNGSSSLAVQTEMEVELSKQWSARVAYKYLKVQAIYDSKMQQQPMIPSHRILATGSWTSLNKRWQADLTLNMVGAMRMPSGYMGAMKSPWYPYVFGQFSHQFKQLKVYLGVENMLNYKQSNPIISADDPSDPSFDATMVWGPITGINVYGGFTYIFKPKKL